MLGLNCAFTVNLYITLMSSRLEYACPVWSPPSSNAQIEHARDCPKTWY